MACRSALLALVVALVAAVSSSAESLAVVVHADRKADLTIEEIGQIYLKRRRFWGNGDPIVPVNRNAGSSPRFRFAQVFYQKQSTSVLAIQVDYIYTHLYRRFAMKRLATECCHQAYI